MFAEEGNDPLMLLTTLANGLGEEVFFRGAIYAALGDRTVVVSTAIYTSATVRPATPPSSSRPE